MFYVRRSTGAGRSGSRPIAAVVAFFFRENIFLDRRWRDVSLPDPALGTGRLGTFFASGADGVPPQRGHGVSGAPRAPSGDRGILRIP